MGKLEELRKIKKDQDKWKWLIANQDTGLIVNLDNDDTFVVDPNDEDSDPVDFIDYVGCSDGVQELLSAVGIKAECL